jgi:HK97 gp10 family phage protein
MTKRFLEEASRVVGGSAKRLAPVDLGGLRGSITSQIKGDRAFVGTNVEYAPYVEYGTGIFAESGGGRKTPWVYYDEKRKRFYKTCGMEAQPFLRPAIDNNRKKIVKLYAAELRKEFSGR